MRRRPLDPPRRTAQTRRRRRLQTPGVLDEGAASAVVRVLRRLVEIQYGREAHIAALEERAPLVAAARSDDFLQPFAVLGPTPRIELPPLLCVLDAELLQQQRVELRLYRAQRDELAIRTSV